MRLFVGVEIDAPMAAAAGALIGTLRVRAQQLAPGCRIAWIPEDRLHLTVRFIGQIDEAGATAVMQALEPPLAVAPFELTVSGPGAFPPAGRPKVIWVGVRNGSEELGRVEREVTRRLATAGIPPEDRPYSPHLTVARVRDAAGLKSSLLFEGFEGSSLGTTHVDAITLFESRLSPHGPAYVPLLRTRLERVNPPR
jgi:2'-5' RNA ligase